MNCWPAHGGRPFFVRCYLLLPPAGCPRSERSDYLGGDRYKTLPSGSQLRSRATADTLMKLEVAQMLSLARQPTNPDSQGGGLRLGSDVPCFATVG